MLSGRGRALNQFFDSVGRVSGIRLETFPNALQESIRAGVLGKGGYLRAYNRVGRTLEWFARFRTVGLTSARIVGRVSQASIIIDLFTLDNYLRQASDRRSTLITVEGVQGGGWPVVDEITQVRMRLREGGIGAFRWLSWGRATDDITPTDEDVDTLVRVYRPLLRLGDASAQVRSQMLIFKGRLDRMEAIIRDNNLPTADYSNWSQYMQADRRFVLSGSDDLSSSSIKDEATLLTEGGVGRNIEAGKETEAGLWLYTPAFMPETLRVVRPTRL